MKRLSLIITSKLLYFLNQFMSVPVSDSKTGTSKVGATSKAQKAQNIFLKKNLKFWNFFLSENVA